MKKQQGNQVTPIKALAVFYQTKSAFEKDSLWTLGLVHGTALFIQPNFPNQQATHLHIQLEFGEAKEYAREYRLEVLFEGRLDVQYCLEGMRYVQLTDFKLPANETIYNVSFKTNEISVTDEWDGIIGRTLRLICLNCELGMEYLGGCAIIARSGIVFSFYIIKNLFKRMK